MPFTDVHVTDEFWAPRIETNRTVTIPSAFQKCEGPGASRTSSAPPRRSAASLQRPDIRPAIPSTTPISYKVIEGASYALSVHPDPKLDAYVDSLIAEDRGRAGAGRLSLHDAHHRSADPARVGRQRSGGSRKRNHSHELYNLGHLYEAAGGALSGHRKAQLSSISPSARADLLISTFGPGKQNDLARDTRSPRWVW